MHELRFALVLKSLVFFLFHAIISRAVLTQQRVASFSTLRNKNPACNDALVASHSFFLSLSLSLFHSTRAVSREPMNLFRSFLETALGDIALLSSFSRFSLSNASSPRELRNEAYRLLRR